MTSDTDDELIAAVLALATDDPDLPEDGKYLVLAALDGDAALAGALESGAPVIPEPASAVATGDPVRAFLRTITVAGFRGIGPSRSLHLHPTPGLTIVAGRNGSGKSSFAEALEVALTRDSSRRKIAATEWQGNWSNLYETRPREIRVELAGDGLGPTTIGVDWPATSEAFTDLEVWVQRTGQRRDRGADPLGWVPAVKLCSPLLPHEELGRLLTAPRNQLYEKLESILGLGRFAEAQERLDGRHKAAEVPATAMVDERRALKKLLAGSADERAVEALRLIGKHVADLDALRALATGSRPTAVGSLQPGSAVGHPCQ